MSKRELAALNGTGDNGGSRHKRRREVGGSSSDMDVTMLDPVESGVLSGGGRQVKEHGLRLWQTVKDAVNKDGRVLSLAFQRKPPKREYPDYYALIKQPIALDDIKKQLDNNGYASLEAVKNDFELLFGNAKQYNLTESVIFQDAKDLLKIAHKTYNKMVPSEEDGENGKPKPPHLTRLIKSRLEKLVAKQVDGGRVLSDEFMQLPSKKLWPIYYQEIKRPQCFEAIFKRIKRKEYETSADFAEDVELVFSNAMTFNQDHTPIWTDAMALKDYFGQLMSDLPPPHNLPQYTKPSNKIKIKFPQASQPTASSSTLQAPKHESGTSSSVLLRVPAAHPPKPTPQAQAPTPAPPVQASTLPAPVPAPTLTPIALKKIASPAPKAATPQVPVQHKAPTPLPPVQQTVSFINATPSHYPRVPYSSPAPIPAAVPAIAPPPPIAARSSTAMNMNIPSASQSPAPVALPPSHQLKTVNLCIQPKGRTLRLDHNTGVKSWAVRLMPGETKILVSNVTFMGDDDENSSDEEDHDAEKREEEDDMDMDVDVEAGASPPTKNGRKKGKGRGRGRPPKAATLAAKAAQATAVALKSAKIKKKAATKIGDVQLKLNRLVIKDQPEQPGEWEVSLPVGSNVIEIGETGGMIWKIYAERAAEP